MHWQTYEAFGTIETVIPRQENVPRQINFIGKLEKDNDTKYFLSLKSSKEQF